MWDYETSTKSLSELSYIERMHYFSTSWLPSKYDGLKCSVKNWWRNQTEDGTGWNMKRTSLIGVITFVAFAVALKINFSTKSADVLSDNSNSLFISHSLEHVLLSAEDAKKDKDAFLIPSKEIDDVYYKNVEELRKINEKWDEVKEYGTVDRLKLWLEAEKLTEQYKDLEFLSTVSKLRFRGVPGMEVEVQEEGVMKPIDLQMNVVRGESVVYTLDLLGIEENVVRADIDAFLVFANIAVVRELELVIVSATDDDTSTTKSDLFKPLQVEKIDTKNCLVILEHNSGNAEHSDKKIDTEHSDEKIDTEHSETKVDIRDGGLYWEGWETDDPDEPNEPDAQILYLKMTAVITKDDEAVLVNRKTLKDDLDSVNVKLIDLVKSTESVNRLSI